MLDEFAKNGGQNLATFRPNLANNDQQVRQECSRVHASSTCPVISQFLSCGPSCEEQSGEHSLLFREDHHAPREHGFSMCCAHFSRGSKKTPNGPNTKSSRAERSHYRSAALLGPFAQRACTVQHIMTSSTLERQRRSKKMPPRVPQKPRASLGTNHADARLLHVCKLVSAHKR